MAHYYTTTGEAAHFRPKKDGSGTRPTTIADARKLGLLPSVTTILDVLRKPGLEKWKIGQAVQAVVTAPDVAGEGLDAKVERVLYTEAQQDEEAKRARDRGTEIHDNLEAYFSGKAGVDSELLLWSQPAIDKIESLSGKVIACEKILVGNGYGGKTDLIMDFSGNHMIIDFKTAKTLPTKSNWPEHALQLAAYAAAWAKPQTTVANLYISTVTPGAIAWFETADWQADYECFAHLVAVWQHMNNYRCERQ